MKILYSLCAALMMAAMTSCDEHREFPDTAMKTCDILCTDGKVVRYEDMESQGKKPIAVVFHINQSDDMQGTGYAVYLWDIDSTAYTDSTGVKMNTSASVTAYDGNTNTHSMYSRGISSSYGSLRYVAIRTECLYSFSCRNTTAICCKEYCQPLHSEVWRRCHSRRS